MTDNINFNTLKYNLYELLNVDPSTETSKIKKVYLKIVKNFHPDKNNELEEDIYHHIILANKILTDPLSKKLYDEYLFNSSKLSHELKTNFKNDMSKIDLPKKITEQEFTELNKMLNQKHGYSDIVNTNVINNFNNIKNIRNNITIEKDDVNPANFNNKFDNNKKNGKLSTQIIESKNDTNELSTYISGGELYTSFSNIDKLYVNDSIQTDKFSSLDRAFALQPVIDVQVKSIEENMKEYNNQTDYINSLFPTKKTN